MANPTKLQKINAFNQKKQAALSALPPGPSPVAKQFAAGKAAAQKSPAVQKALSNAQQLTNQAVVAQNVAQAGNAPLNPPGQVQPQAKGSKQAQGQKPLTNAQIIQLMAQQTRAVRDAQKAQLAQARAEQEEAANQVERLGMAADDTAQVIGATTAPGIRWLSRLPTPGGIATMLLILVFFLLAVFPVNSNGDTRLKLLWLTLTGKTHLRYGDTSTGATTTTPATVGSGDSLIDTDMNGNCPPGYSPVIVAGGKRRCQPNSSHGGPVPTNHVFNESPINIDMWGLMGFGN